jgi:hypothetical protein
MVLSVRRERGGGFGEDPTRGREDEAKGQRTAMNGARSQTAIKVLLEGGGMRLRNGIRRGPTGTLANMSSGCVSHRSVGGSTAHLKEAQVGTLTKAKEHGLSGLQAGARRGVGATPITGPRKKKSERHVPYSERDQHKRRAELCACGRADGFGMS